MTTKNYIMRKIKNKNCNNKSMRKFKKKSLIYNTLINNNNC